MSRGPNPSQVVVAGSRWGIIFFVFAFLWAIIVFLSYFLNPDHPLGQVLPFLGKIFDVSVFPTKTSPEFWEIQKQSFGIFFTTFLISGTTWAVGRRLRLWLGLNFSDAWVRFPFDFGLGIVSSNLLWIGLGLNRLWFDPILKGFGAFLSLVFLWDLWGHYKDGLKIAIPPNTGLRLLTGLGLFYWLFSFLQNLTPETFYDSMVYHLAFPQYWILQHGLADCPTNFYSNYPFGAETYFLNGLFWQGTETAKCLHAVSFGVCALLAGGWARELAGQQAGWLALGLTLTLPLFAVNIWTTQVEGFLALALTLAVYAFCRFAFGEGPLVAWALLAGLFGGLALSVKYTALLTLGGTLIVLAVQRPSLLWREKGKICIPLFLAGVLVLAPWLLKNLAFTGNPFFPYLMDYFQGRHLPQWGYERLLEEQHASIASGPVSWLLLPWSLTMGNPDSFNFCGPLPLALLPFFFVFKIRQPALRFLVFLTPLLFVTGLMVANLLRFILPAFVLLYILAGALLEGGEKPAWGRGWAWVGAFSALLCFPYLGAIHYYYYSCAGVLSGRQSRAEYLEGPGKIAPYFQMAQWVSANLPPEARLLVAGDARGLYYGRPSLTNSVFDEQVLAKLAREEKDRQGIARRLKEMGVDYLAVNGLEGIRVSADYHHYDLSPEEWKRLDDFIQRDTTQVYFDEPRLQGVYQLSPPGLSSARGKVDPLLFFSKPASQFVKDIRKHQWVEADGDLREVLKLYPFSVFWKDQAARFEKSLGPIRDKGRP